MTPTRTTLLEWFYVQGGKLYWKRRPANRVHIGTLAGAINRTHTKIVTVPGYGRFSIQTLMEIINAK